MRLNIKEIRNKSLIYLESNCRKLELEILRYNFFDGSVKGIVEELKKYQNSDGGFGNALESDYRMPASSPLATTMALRILEKLTFDYEEKILEEAIHYLERTFNPERKAWFAASKEINNYPRAVWWNYDEKQGGVSIDKNWGNPSIEIIGYLFKYRNYLERTDIKSLVANALEYINNLKSEDSEEHEIYCFLHFYELIDREDKEKIKDKLKELVKFKMNINKDEWEKYVPQPINFIYSKNSFLYEEYKEVLHENLMFLYDKKTQDLIWEPTWEWYQFEEEWKKAKKEWIGVLTVNYLKLFDEFNMILK